MPPRWSWSDIRPSHLPSPCVLSVRGFPHLGLAFSALEAARPQAVRWYRGVVLWASCRGIAGP